MRRLITGLTAVPLLALSALSGCGGGGGETSSADDTPSAGSSSSAPAEDPSPAPSAGDEPSASDDAAADAPGNGTKYCELLGTDFATLFANVQGPEDVAAAIDIIEQIGAEEPAEVEEQWGRIEGALGQVEDALTQAARLQKQAASGKVTPEQLQKQSARLTKDMQALNTPANAKAGDVVAKHATEYCGLTLG